MPIQSSTATNLGKVPHLGKEASANIQIQKGYQARAPQSAKIDLELSEKQSIKAKSSVQSRQSIASLVNENKGQIGKKVDISV